MTREADAQSKGRPPPLTPGARAERKLILAYLLRLSDEQKETARNAVRTDPLMTEAARVRIGDFYHARALGIAEAYTAIRGGKHRRRAT